MTSHFHLIIGSAENQLSDIMRNLKRHTSEMLHSAVAKNGIEGRREGMLRVMHRAAARNNNAAKFQLWQAENQPWNYLTVRRHIKN